MPEIGVNKVILIGRTGADTELKYTSNGKAVANFSLAINDSFKNGDGEQRERVEWVRCVAWGRLAEICGEFLIKGAALMQRDACRHASTTTAMGSSTRSARLSFGSCGCWAGQETGNGGAEHNDRPAENHDAGIPEEDIPF